MMVQRSVKHPYMTLFDGADGIASTDQRSASLTPLQALYFMNAAFPKRCSDHLAGELEKGVASDQARIDRAFLSVLGRAPAKVERQRSLQFVQQVSAKYEAQGSTPVDAHRQALSHLVQAMFSSNEFMFIE
jgi:hypothetical protein